VSVVAIDAATGVLLVDGRRTFPIVLSNGPPPGRKAPNGRNGLAEVAAAGVNFVRTGSASWSAQEIDAQRALLDAAAQHGLLGWLWLGGLPNLPQGPSPRAQQLAQVVDGLQGHPALGAYKGIDEPRNIFRGKDWIRADGLVRAYERLRQLDPAHPVVIIQAPNATVAQLRPYRPAFDVTGADVYPVSYPPGTHVPGSSRDLSVVGDLTRTMVQAAGAKPVWMTLQIAWSGVLPPKHVPRFPDLHQERFMAYQAIACGARGLTFFGGHLTQVATPADAAAGWNWTFWETVLRPLVRELSSDAVRPALVAPNAGFKVAASVAGVDLVTRQDGKDVYVIAARRGGTVSRVTFSGLPKTIAGGRVLHEYVQEPPPPPIEPGHQVFRAVEVSGGSFTDWFAPHDVHVYRFAP
jgi:hypothetical protein